MHDVTTAVTANRKPIPILTYHQIAPKPPKGTPFRSLCVDPKDFAHQMEFLRLLGYQGLSMTALMPYLRGEKEGKVVGITFDDGYQNNLVHALPVLQRLGFSSTCYVVSQLLGKTNDWDMKVGIPQVPLMSVDELRHWLASGQEVGGHTRHHVNLTQINAEECFTEVDGCKLELEALFDQRIVHFCYPYGDYGDTQAAIVKKSGFLTATTTRRGRIYVNADWWQLRRVSVARRTSRVGLLIKMLTNYEDQKK